jgi:hypothetical protein
LAKEEKTVENLNIDETEKMEIEANLENDLLGEAQAVEEEDEVAQAEDKPMSEIVVDMNAVAEVLEEEQETIDSLG